MKNKTLFAAFAAAILLLFPIPALANSSWAWLTDARPIYLLPFAVVITLFIEIFIVAKYNNIKKMWIVIAVICLANLLSFIAPYLFRAWLCISDGFTFEYSIDKGPSYIVMAGYAFLTILVELPMVYFFLSHYVQNKKRLIITILLANMITTLFVAVCERLICDGSW